MIHRDASSNTFGSRLVVLAYLESVGDWTRLLEEAAATRDLEGTSELQRAKAETWLTRAYEGLMRRRSDVGRRAGTVLLVVGGGTAAVGTGFLIQGAHIGTRFNPSLASGWVASGGGITALGAFTAGVGGAIVAQSIATIQAPITPSGASVLLLPMPGGLAIGGRF